MRRLAALLLAAGLLTSLYAPAAAQASLTLLRPDPLVSGTFYGRGGLSTDAASQGSVRAQIPAGATVVNAWVYAAGTPWIESSTPTTLDFGGTTVPVTTINNDNGGVVVRGDVTELVAAAVSSEGGTYFFSFTNPGMEGVALAVVYADASAPLRTIAILDGGSLPTGDSATFNFSSPIDPAAEGFDASLALGITFSYQGGTGDHNCGSGQVSNVDVNGSRLSSCAGGADDSNGGWGLITMGGVGDSTNNPPDPNGPGGEDDELYNLVPLLTLGDTSLTVSTVNPSNDDYIFFAGITITARASVSTTGAPTISSIADQVIPVNSSTSALPFTVGDGETAASDLTVTAVSSDQAVIDNADISVSGTGAERTVTVASGAVAGSATIALTVTDGDANQSLSTFLVTVEEPTGPPPPTAAADSATTDEDVTLNGDSVLGNDTNPGVTTMTAALGTDVAHGTLTLHEDGTYSYVPDANWNGTDTFTYTAWADGVESAPATVTITVSPVSDLPTCENGTLDVARNTPTNGQIVCTSVDDETFTIEPSTPAAAHGTITNVDPETGTFTYTPDEGFHGTDVVWFIPVLQREGEPAAAKIDITIGGGNAAPVAVTDNLTVSESLHPTGTAYDVRDNDTDEDGDALALVDVTQPAHGTVTIVDGDAVYTPDAMYAGTDSFTYDIEDGFGGSDTGTVQVTVEADVTGPAVVAPTQGLLAPATGGRLTSVARVSWSEPEDATGIVGYDLELSRDWGTFVTKRSVMPGTTYDLSVANGHTYRVRVRSVDGAGNRGPWVLGSAFRVSAAQTPSLTYHGTWHVVTQSSSAGTGFRYTTSMFASATFTATGRSFAWLAPTNRLSGKAQVYVDGVYAGTVNLYSSTSVEKRQVWSATFPTSGTHTIRIRNLATSGHPRMSVDAMLVLR